MLLNNYQPQGRGTRKATPYALILAPTRELTSQIYDEARKFTFQTGIRPVVIYGGAPVVNQVRGVGGRGGGGLRRAELGVVMGLDEGCAALRSMQACR